MTVGDVITYRHGVLEAEFLLHDTAWMVGSIKGDREVVDESERTSIVHTILDAIRRTPADNNGIVTCTDGRYRMWMASGDRRIETAEQLVGSSIVTGLAAADALGEDFYSGKVAPDSPIAQRVNYVADFLNANGEKVTTHGGCGGADNLDRIFYSSLTFVSNPSFRERMRSLMPEDLYDDEIVKAQRQENLRKIDQGAYHGYSAGLITAAAVRLGGEAAIETFLNDRRGVHGHVEDVIVRLDHRLGGVALTPNTLIESNLNVQAFGINGSAIDRLAHIFSNGGNNQGAYVRAWHAMETFTDSGHGLLAHNLPTLLVRAAA